MKVLIVGKTRRGTGACVGGITEAGRSVRLIAADASSNERAGLQYEVGEVWELEFVSASNLVPPHIEDVIVWAGTRLRHSAKMERTILRFMPPVAGGPEKLFEGLLRATSAGALYVSKSTGIPPRSTMFWRPDKPLELDVSGKRIRYRYPTKHGGYTLTFVGFQEPLPAIEAGTLLRVSLAHWWRPEDHPERELRCFLQLSGWCLSPRAEVQEEAAPVKPKVKPTGSVPNDKRLPDSAAVSARIRSLTVLKETFGYSSFLPVQADVIARVLERKDTLVVMPTGAGKSLCFQLPSVLFEGLTVVISPLVALMQDQVRQLRALNVPAACLNHMVPLAEYTSITHQVRLGRIRLLYVAPETLMRPETLLLLRQGNLTCMAVDEAHCISEWGHDFRPEYRQLQALRSRFPDACWVALTATATPRVRDDIRNLLGIPREGQFVASFNRQNLFLAAEQRSDVLEQVLDFLEPRRGQCGIIYCGTRKQTDELAASLQANGWPALAYHAGLDDAVRRRNQERFITSEAPLMVATIAFGMGINRADIRFVIHAHLPSNLENYYQEIGRAGRDGLAAQCLLLFARRDAVVHRLLIEKSAESERPGRRARLAAVMDFAECAGCRRVPLLRYFGEKLPGPCGNCDNCAPASLRHEHPIRGHRFSLRAILRPLVRRRFHEVGEHFAAGKSVDEIALLYGTGRGTVLENLWKFVEAGGTIDPNRLLTTSSLSSGNRARVIAAFESLGTDRLAPVHRALSGEITYDELHLVRLYVVCRKKAVQTTQPRRK